MRKPIRMGIDRVREERALERVGSPIFNDMWRYSPASGEWTWVDGSNTVSAKGVYGDQGAAAAANVPGARDNVASWTDAGGYVWLFGGEGLNSSGADPNAPQWNDLWKYPTR